MISSPYKKAVLLFIVLLFPSIFYLYLLSGSHKIEFLDYYGPRDSLWVEEDGEMVLDTVIFHTIPDFTFQDQSGNNFSRKDMIDNIVIVDYFFTTCPDVCPKMSTQMVRVQERVKEAGDVIILSYTVYPEHDTVEVLAQYASEYNADPKIWHFLTGSKKELYDLARNGYFITATKGDGGPEDFIHDEKFVLIDKYGRIRGYYEGTDREDVERLIDEIKVLKAEELIPLKR